VLNTCKLAFNNAEDTINYFIESDYIHKKNSKEALFDIFNNFGFDNFVSLYDNPDKYYPYFFNTWYDLGRTRFLLEEWEGALTAFNQAEKIKPDFPELQAYQAKSMCKIGLKYEQQGSFNQAMDWYEKAIFEDSICEMAYNSKAFLFFKQQKPEEAARCLQLGVKQVPESFDLNANLGKVYMQLQMADSALIWFKRALQIRPGDPQLQGVISSIESSLQP
jgi:tetratricopeptide (TPR) repeat protein